MEEKHISEKHIIEHAVFDLVFGPERATEAESDALRVLIQEALLPVVDEVFSEVSQRRAGTIDQLTIDLGIINVHDFRESLKDLLRIRLKDALEEALPLRPARTNVRDARSHSALTWFETLLLKGHLPSHHILEKGRTLDEMLTVVLSTSGEVLTTFLVKSKQQSQIIKRLVYQCSEENLSRIVYLFAPTQSETLLALVKNLKTVLGAVPGVVLTEAALAHEIWTSLFALLLQAKKGVIDPRMLFDHIRKKISTVNNRAEKQVLEALRELHEHSEISVSHLMQAPEQAAEEAAALETLATLKRDLTRAITEGRPEVLRTIWHSVLRDHALLLKGILLDRGRMLAVRRVLSRRFTDTMLRDIVSVIDPAARDFVHEIVTRPSIFRQVKDKPEESEAEVKSQLWEFTLTYLIVERGSFFNKKTYLGSLIAQMAAHENRAYADLLYGLMSRLDAITLPNRIKSEMRDLLASLAKEHEAEKNSPISESDALSDPSELIQAYDDYETLRRVFFEEGDARASAGQANEEAVIRAIDALIRRKPVLLLRFFRTFQAEAGRAEAPLHSFSAQGLLKLIQVFILLSARLHTGSSDLMQSLEAHVASRRDLKNYYMQILVCLIRNEEIDFEVITSRDRVRGQVVFSDESGEKGSEATQDVQLHVWRAKIIEALVQGRPQMIQDFWPEFLRTQASWLRQTLLVRGQNEGVREKLSSTFSDRMLRDIVGLIAPEVAPIVYEVVTRPQLFQDRSVAVSESEKEHKVQLWQYTLTYLFVARGSHFNNKSYLSSLITQMASHRNHVYSELLLALTEAFETSEASRAVKSEMLQILRDLSEEVKKRKPVPETEATQNVQGFDVDVAYEDLKDFLTGGVWPKARLGFEAGESLLSMINLLFQSDPGRLSRLFRELASGGLFAGQGAFVCPPEIFFRLIEIFWFLSNPADVSASSDFMQAMQHHARQAEHQGRYYRRIFACLIEKRLVDFEAILLQDTRDVHALPGHEMQEDLNQEGLNKTRTLHLSTPLAAAFELLEKRLRSPVVLSSQASRHFLEMLEDLLLRAPQDLAVFLKRWLENREIAARLIHLLTEPLLIRVLLLLQPVFFNQVLRTTDLLASAACVKEIALSPGRITRLKWQFIFQYFFEEGQRFQAQRFVRLFTEILARDAYYSDLVAFRLKLRAQLESHRFPSMNNEVLQLMNTLSQIDQMKPTDVFLSEASVSDENLEVADEALEEWDETIQVENAGLVIAAPYFERFFSLLGLSEARAFKSPEATQRAVHLLQFLVNESSDTPEYQLVLNKVLCGLGPGIPIVREISVTAYEKEGIEGLIKGMIANWKQIGETSIQGFRESFLQREGTLRRKGDDWHLQITPKAFDILLDYIPWSFSLVKLPWMQRVIHVKWRSSDAS